MRKQTTNLSDSASFLPISFYSACDYFQQETIKRPNGLQNTNQILFVLDGSGVLYCQGKSFTLKKGCAFFTAAGIPMDYINTGGLISAFITVKGPAIYDIIKHFSCDGFLFYESVNTDKFTYSIKQIINKYYENPKQQGILSALAYSLFMEFFEQQNSSYTKLDEVVFFMERSFAEKITLERLAQIGCMSVSKLSHDFKKKYGYSVFKHILKLRLNYARSLLISNPEISVKDTAYSCGFEDVSYFCRAYKKKFGVTPSEKK